jgi:hypothetical protein
LTSTNTCRYTVGREDELTGLWTYGYRCGKPSVPGLALDSTEHKAGACIEHLNGLHSPYAELRRILRSRKHGWRWQTEEPGPLLRGRAFFLSGLRG